VRSVIDVGPTGVVFSGSVEPSEQHVYRWDGTATRAVTDEPGVHAAVVDGDLAVVVTATLDEPTVRTVARRLDGSAAGRELGSLAVVPRLEPTVQLLRDDDLEVAVLLPRDHVAGTPLPVLMDPYGGPHFGQVIKAQGMLRESQWFADQGFAVVICDGRGTPRDPQWERAVRFDLSDVVLEDQVRALAIAAANVPDLDTSRVAMRGWSFGGFLSAMAVIRRPDVFHAAVAGAPVTDFRLYDTAYTERYLGLPQEHPDAYERGSLLGDAPGLSRPLMLIHGFADDNVLVANTMQLSGVLMAAGRPHTVLPLTGVTHMTPQEEVAENLLLLQVQFLQDALAHTDE
jgi:dipeptidyl-peptidase 4